MHEETEERQRDSRRNDAKDTTAPSETRSFGEGRSHVTRDSSGGDMGRRGIGDHQPSTFESRRICDEDRETETDAVISNQLSVKVKSQSDRLIKTSIGPSPDRVTPWRLGKGAQPHPPKNLGMPSTARVGLNP